MVKFQLDSGATFNLLPAKYLEDRNELTQTRKRLPMYNDTMIKPLGTCKMEVPNLKNARSYHVEFVVVDSDRAVPILGNQTMQQMDLIRVQQHKVMSVNTSQAGFTAEVHDEVIDGATPVVYPPRRVPVALKGKLKKELDRLQSLGIKEQVTDPTPWVSSLVTVLKPNGQIRVCIDPKDLNRVLRRSHCPTPTIDKILPELSRAKVFSTVDAKNGFWHIELDDDSLSLTTFNSPFGLFRWLRLPFGLCTAPEEFQRRLNHALVGLKGVRTIHDDILVFGEGSTGDKALVDHDRNLRSLMQRCRERNVKLNKAKVTLRRGEVPFLGHLITKDGLKADPAKVSAVLEMPTPTDVASVCWFIGFTNYLSKFLPHLSDVCEPLRKLTLPEVEWFWTNLHDSAVQQVKRLVTNAPVLKYFDSTKGITLQCDASDKGLGAVLMQDDHPVAYVSCALTYPETRYAQIEKELLAVVYGLEKFHTYTYGRRVTVESDHKPLEVMVKKPLHLAPKRLQRMLLRVQANSINLGYRKGPLCTWLTL